MKEYRVRVAATTIVSIGAESWGEAIGKARELGWKYDWYELNCEAAKEDEERMGELPELRPYRSYHELLKEPEDMTEEERRRLAKIKAIPKEVVAVCEERIHRLDDYVRTAETESDRLKDFLNGEEAST